MYYYSRYQYTSTNKDYFTSKQIIFQYREWSFSFTHIS